MGDWVAGSDRLSAIVAVADSGVLSGPQLVIVDGRHGSGRSFVLEQAYRVFVASENDSLDTYWPASLRSGALVADGFAPTSGSVLDRLWLGVDGDVLAGHGLHQLADQFDAHAVVLRRTLEARRSIASRLTYWAAQTAGLVVTGVGLFTPGMHVIAALAAVYSFALAVDATGRAGDQALSGGSVEEAKRFNAGWAVNPREAAQLRAGVEALASGLALVSGEIPILLVIDDAEALDAHTVELVQAILAGSGNITVAIAVDLEVVGGAWGLWLRHMAGGAHERCQVAQLAALPVDDLAALSVTVIPDLPWTSNSEMARLLELSRGLPGVLMGYLSMPVVRDALRAGRPLPLDLAGLTEDARDDQHHADLPESVRDTLELLACLGEATSTNWVTSLGVTADQLRTSEATRRLTVAADGLVRFGSWRAYQTALRACRRHRTTERTQALMVCYRQCIEKLHGTSAWRSAPSQAQEAALSTLTGYFGELSDPAWLTELLDLRRRGGTLTDINDSVLKASLTRLTTPGVGAARLARAVADSLTALGHRDMAIALAQRELDEVTTKRGPTDGARIPHLEMLAYLNAATGHDLRAQPEASTYLTAAVQQFKEILSLRESRLRTMLASGDPGSPNLKEKTLEIRWNLAEALVDLRAFKGPEGALRIAQRVIDELVASGHASHPNTLSRRSRVARWFGEAGEFDRSRDLHAELGSDWEQILGPDDPNTLVTRADLALMTGEAGEPVKARDMYGRLLPALVRTQGPDAFNTLECRLGLARWTYRTGDPVTARDMYAELLRDQLRVLGPDHPNVLTTFNNLAILETAPERARDIFAGLLPDLVRQRGADHAFSMVTRGNLANATGLAGEPAKARDMYAELLRDQMRVLGPDHPNVLTTRSNLARWTGRGGGLGVAGKGAS